MATDKDKITDYTIVQLSNGKYAAQYLNTNTFLDIKDPHYKWQQDDTSIDDCYTDTIGEVENALNEMIRLQNVVIPKPPTITKKIKGFGKNILRTKKLDNILNNKPNTGGKRKTKKELALEWKNSLSNEEKEFLKILTKKSIF